MSWFRKSKPAPEAPAPAPTGATFGPWATHESRCKCNVCR